VSAGHGEHEVNQHAPIQGQFANGRGLDDLSDAGVRRLQYFTASRDSYSLRDGTNQESDIHGKFLPHFQAQSLLCRSQAGRFDLQIVVIRQERWRLEASLLVRDDATDRARARGSQLDRRPRNGKMLRIGDRTCENGVVALAKSRQSKNQKK
jgi:hypothetical protein